MTQEVQEIIRRIVEQCPPSMLDPAVKSYFLKDLVLSVSDIQKLHEALKAEQDRKEAYAI